jgi:hypothetical protein
MKEVQYAPAWPHGKITQLFTNIFYVMGTNIITHDAQVLQYSRNMIIIRHDGDQLSLINTVRLDDAGLADLDALGIVKNVIRIGAFHDRDDSFYLSHYPAAKLWALKDMEHKHGRTADYLLKLNGEMPFTTCSFIPFDTSKFPEGVLHIDQEGGILITCDSIKNWVSADPFFSSESAISYEKQGFFGVATISSIWKNACEVQASDFKKLTSLKFNHLLSAHGEPLLDQAYEAVTKTIEKEYGNSSSTSMRPGHS